MQCWDALVASDYLATLNPRSQAILRKVLRGNNGICSRHLAFDHLQRGVRFRSRRTRRAVCEARARGRVAGRRARARPTRASSPATSTPSSSARAPDISARASRATSPSGSVCATDILALDLVGQGCGAAMPNMRAGEALLAGGRARRVLSICVEICSAAMYLDDDPGVLISACLFGDGAGAAVLTAEPMPGRRRIEWKSAGTLMNAGDRDELRFERRRGMLRNILTPAVPAIAARHVDRCSAKDSSATRLSRDDISGWILHAGGREILAAVRQQRGPDRRRHAMERGGPARLRQRQQPVRLFRAAGGADEQAPGGYWWMSSFGAGFSCHGALLEVE